MLVLALQFSRDGKSAAGAAEAKCGLQRCRRLPQNGREDARSNSSRRGGELNLDPKTCSEDDPPVHQLGVAPPFQPTQSTAGGEVTLLRKEVIQPHLPVRLPCYDFTPIANPTFDSSFPKGLGHWLRVLPTFVV